MDATTQHPFTKLITLERGVPVNPVTASMGVSFITQHCHSRIQANPSSWAFPTLQQNGFAKCTGISHVPVSLIASRILILVGTACSVAEHAAEFQLGM
jgi:hypothetical protein